MNQSENKIFEAVMTEVLSREEALNSDVIEYVNSSDDFNGLIAAMSDHPGVYMMITSMYPNAICVAN